MEKFSALPEPEKNGILALAKIFLLLWLHLYANCSTASVV
jgi:hypothetical protein